MRRNVSPDTTALIVELQQMLFDFGHEIDANQGRYITDFYAEDGVWLLGTQAITGHVALREFYTRYYERVAREQKGGQRQLLHAFTNVRVSIAADKAHAAIDFFNLNFSAEGPRPISGPIMPTMIVDCRMDCRREADGVWRIVRFTGTPQFIGADASPLVTNG